MTRSFVAALALSLAAATALVPPAPARAQQARGAELEARLPTLGGIERARALARLTDAHKLDEPARAIAYGQEALRLLESYPDDSARVATLNEMGWAFMQLGRYDEAVRHAERGRRLAAHAGLAAGQARALSNLGTLAQRRGDPVEAVELFTEALALQREAGDELGAANTLNNLGFVYSTDLADYERALKLHHEALRVRERLGDREAIALSLNNIGIVYGRLRRYGESLAHFDSALAMRRALGGRVRIAATLSNIGDIRHEMGDHELALASHMESLELRRLTGDRSAISLSHHNLGILYRDMGRHELALAHLDTALRIGEAVGDRGLVVRNLLGASAVERAGGRVARAQAHATHAMSVARGMESREMVRRSWEELAAVHEAAGRHREALAAHRAFKALSDSILDAGTARRVAMLERRHATERRELELERLRAQEQVYRLEAERRTAQRNALAVAIVLLAVAGLLAYRRRAGRARAAEELSMTDSLTGLRNRRYLQQTIEKDAAASLRRYRAPASLVGPPDDGDIVFLLLDIDHFKRVNDELGHAVGDRLLVDVARVLEGVGRESDVTVRWGGEEFLVVSRFTDRARAAAQAERIRRAVESHVTRLPDGRELRVTCSIGFCAFPLSVDAPAAAGWEDVVSLADLASYAAKRKGRNRWVGYLGGSGAPPDGALHATPADVDRWLAEGRLRMVTPEQGADGARLESLTIG
ncbi:MAG TPA: tetratricopeptide repeat-containing diguanylate cyclase [Gemmatimonadaceae bacterium]|nr:tetratricopeptide repeat-containing diguanylate cyclase [Gemmatimonadaceae bacterium]